jgi:predicted nucleic acid-binding protein
LGWLDDIQGKVVGLDTSPLIYLIESHPRYLDVVQPFFEAVDQGQFQIVTSAITLLEVLVHPFRQVAVELAGQYREIILNSNGISCIDVSSEVAVAAALIRAQHNLRTPDAIQLATSIHEGAAYFFTNDASLPSIQSLSLLLLDELEAPN